MRRFAFVVFRIGVTLAYGLNQLRSPALIRGFLPVLMLGYTTLAAPAQYNFRTESIRTTRSHLQGSIMPSGALVIPNTIDGRSHRIGTWLLCCTSLTSVTIPTASQHLAEAFYGCTALASVKIPTASQHRRRAFMGARSDIVTIPTASQASETWRSLVRGLTSVTSRQRHSIGNMRSRLHWLTPSRSRQRHSIREYAFYG